MSALLHNDRLKRFGTVLGVIWGFWVPALALEPARSFIESHVWLLWAQGPLVATGTLLIGEWGRSRAGDAESV